MGILSYMKALNGFKGILIFLISVSVSFALPVKDVQLATGFDYSTGDYGSSSETKMLYIPFTSKFVMENYEIKVTVPYVSMSSEGDVINLDGQAVSLSSDVMDDTESGVGDIVTSCSYYFLEEDGLIPYVDLTGKIKLGTADEDKGLGSGETDFSFSADVTKSIEPAVCFGTLGYKIYGDPSGMDLDNVFFISLGACRKINEEYTAGGFYDYRQKTSDYGNPISELTGYVSYKLSKQYKMMGYIVKGLDEGSPDWGIGATITRKTEMEEIKRPFSAIQDWIGRLNN